MNRDPKKTKGKSHTYIWRKRVPSYGKSDFKDTVTEVGLECLTNSKGANVAGSEWKYDEKQEIRLYLWPDAQPDWAFHAIILKIKNTITKCILAIICQKFKLMLVSSLPFNKMYLFPKLPFLNETFHRLHLRPVRLLIKKSNFYNLAHSAGLMCI